MSEEPAREWRFYIDDMRTFAQRVGDYSSGMDQAGSEASIRTDIPPLVVALDQMRSRI